MPTRAREIAVAGLMLVLPAGGCTVSTVQPRLFDPPALPSHVKGKSEPLKVHLLSGELLVLNEWRLSAEDRLTGVGDRYDGARLRTATKQPVDVALAEIAVIEASEQDSETSIGLGVMGLVSLVVSSVTVACSVDPKGCFGSCPTFYVEAPDGELPDRPQAEGFSESIARVLEARDVDALLVSRSAGSPVSVVMRNEALETHAVRRVHLLAAPQPAGARVLAGSDARLYAALALEPPLACSAPEGDCLEAVRAADGADRASTADGADLATRETLELSFSAARRGRNGIVVGARQTLLSTFLFYQTLAFTGRGAGEFLAQIERGGPEAGRRALGMARLLGGIDVEVAEGARPWRAIGSFDEAGPIAGDVRVIPFDATGEGPLRVRLRLARGHWRLDWVASARLGATVEPVRLEPERVERDGRLDEGARARLVAGTRHLVTRPGDAYRLTFRLPPGDGRFELFLESEGFYYEWMRREWLAEEEPQLALLAVADPAAALRRLAPAYKAREGRLEREFWASRFRK